MPDQSDRKPERVKGYYAPDEPPPADRGEPPMQWTFKPEHMAAACKLISDLDADRETGWSRWEYEKTAQAIADGGLKTN